MENRDNLRMIAIMDNHNNFSKLPRTKLKNSSKYYRFRINFLKLFHFKKALIISNK